jgi:hypothetical protein
MEALLSEFFGRIFEFHDLKVQIFMSGNDDGKIYA